eukprot:31488-Pelagococcus_subviridis.AAC.2
MSVVPSIVALVALVVQNTALVFAMKLAFRDTAKSFHVSVVVLCAEAFKFCVCCAISIFTRKSPGMTFKYLTRIFDHRMALPSLLYVVQNNILFVAVQHLTPTVYVACSQTKVLATVFFSVTFLNVKLTIRQIVAVFLLTAAMISLQLPESTPVSDANLVGKKSSQVTGFAAVFCSSGISGFASVYMERLLKARDGDFTLFEQNIQLGCRRANSSRRREIRKLNNEVLRYFCVNLSSCYSLMFPRYRNDVFKCFSWNMLDGDIRASVHKEVAVALVDVKPLLST